MSNLLSLKDLNSSVLLIYVLYHLSLCLFWLVVYASDNKNLIDLYSTPSHHGQLLPRIVVKVLGLSKFEEC